MREWSTRLASFCFAESDDIEPLALLNLCSTGRVPRLTAILLRRWQAEEIAKIPRPCPSNFVRSASLVAGGESVLSG